MPVMLRPFTRVGLSAFLLYGIGYTVPLLIRDLGISETTAGLHASAIAIGTVASGLGSDRFMRWLGRERAALSGTVTTAVACALVAVGPHVGVTLLGAALLGAGGGLLLSWINHLMSELGGAGARLGLARASLVGLAAGLVAPLAIAALEAAGSNGRYALLLPLPLVAAVELLTSRRGTGRAGAGAESAPEGPEEEAPVRRLPATYWRAWVMLVLFVTLEFTFVFWGALVIELRTLVPTAEATTAAAAFVVGMFAARVLLAAGIGTHAPRIGLTAGALAAVIVGVLGAWQATSVPLATASLFLAGLGVGPLYPIGIAYALSLVPAGPLAVAASARATLATGLALTTAPVLLAVIAERIGLVNAWPLVAVIAAATIGLVYLTRWDGPAATADRPATR